MRKTHQVRSNYGSWDVEKVHAVVARSTFQVKMLKAQNAWTTFEGSDVVLRGRRKGFCTVPKVSNPWQFCSTFKSVGRRGTFEEDLERCTSRGRRSTLQADMFSQKKSKMLLVTSPSALLTQLSIFENLQVSLRWFCWHHFSNLAERQHFSIDTHRYEADQICTQISIFDR